MTLYIVSWPVRPFTCHIVDLFLWHIYDCTMGFDQYEINVLTRGTFSSKVNQVVHEFGNRPMILT